MSVDTSCCVSFCLFLLFFFLAPADSKCPDSFICGNLGALEFPFSDVGLECGLFMVNCSDPVPKIQLRNTEYEILQKLSTNSLRIRDPILEEQLNLKTCASLRNLTILPNDFNFTSLTISPSFNLFLCFSSNDTVTHFFENYTKTECGGENTVYYRPPINGIISVEEREIPQECLLFVMPFRDNNTGIEPGSSNLFKVLSAEFVVEFNVLDDCIDCHGKGGKCFSDRMDQFVCQNVKGKSHKKVILATALSGSAALVLFLVLFIIWQRKKRIKDLSLLSRTISSDPSSKSDIEGGSLIFGIPIFSKYQAKHIKDKNVVLFLKNHDNLAQKRYKYSHLKKITKSFSDNLGKGGYGTVFKGKLHDDRLVAVKILDEAKGNGEDFMNEVASISRTSHVNIVSLLGFCIQGSKRALVYEFVPNGSLDKFIDKIGSESGLGWEKLFEISVGIAKGLEYLHQGCSTRIVHFDIKPHNILLDKDLKPKISDFGLAKLCPNRSSVISMLTARGTIGYIAPEVFCRNFGNVSHKSDVYSYGMMTLDLAMGRKNVDSHADRSSDMYFPDYIYKQLDRRGNVENGIVAEEDEWHFVKKKLVIIGLWCIQNEPQNRPSISQVIEMLEGKLEDLKVPPRPHLSSPQRSLITFSNSESVSL